MKTFPLRVKKGELVQRKVKKKLTKLTPCGWSRSKCAQRDSTTVGKPNNLSKVTMIVPWKSNFALLFVQPLLAISCVSTSITRNFFTSHKSNFFSHCALFKKASKVVFTMKKRGFLSPKLWMQR